MEQREILVSLSEEAARRYDAALTGNDDDLLLAVEKEIMATLYPERRSHDVRGYVDTDSDIVAVEPIA